MTLWRKYNHQVGDSSRTPCQDLVSMVTAFSTPISPGSCRPCSVIYFAKSRKHIDTSSFPAFNDVTGARRHKPRASLTSAFAHKFQGRNDADRTTFHVVSGAVDNPAVPPALYLPPHSLTYHTFLLIAQAFPETVCPTSGRTAA